MTSTDEMDNIPNTTVYIPEFYEDSVNVSRNDPQLMKKVLSQKNWITEELHREIHLLFPTADEIKNNATNERCMLSFKEKAKKLFPVGRVFASNKQLDQVASMFCSAWAIKNSSW